MLIIDQRNRNVPSLFYEYQDLQATSFSGKTETDPEAPLGIVPIDGTEVADHEAGPAFKTTFISKVNCFPSFVPLITSCRTRKSTGLMATLPADLPVHPDVRFRVNPKTHQFKKIIDNHINDRPPFQKSARSWGKGTPLRIAFQAMWPNPLLEFPSAR